MAAMVRGIREAPDCPICSLPHRDYLLCCPPGYASDKGSALPKLLLPLGDWEDYRAVHSGLFPTQQPGLARPGAQGSMQNAADP